VHQRSGSPSDAPAYYQPQGLIGIIDLSTCTSLTAEVCSVLPTGVGAVFSRLRLPQGGAITPESLDEMLSGDRLEQAALQLSDAEPDVIAFACTSGSFLHGLGYDDILIGRIEQTTGVQATTTSTAMLRALRATSADVIGVGTPYSQELTSMEVAFLESAGFTVAQAEGLGLLVDRDVGRITDAQLDALVDRVASPRPEAVFLSCTNLPSFTRIAGYEERHGIPVLTSNSATVWDCLGLVGVRPDAGQAGRLLAGEFAHPSGRSPAKEGQPAEGG